MTQQPTSRPLYKRPVFWVEVFLAVNLGFLALDIYVAHSMNSFAHWAEWIPFYFSCAAPVLLVVCWLLIGGLTPLVSRSPADSEEEALASAALRAKLGRWLAMGVGWLAILVGIAGMVYHLESRFFHEQTLENLVYAAPFVAPLAYTGLGLLALANQMVRAQSRDWARWVILLAWGGFVGNFVLSLVDHAQNGFFDNREWIPVIASAFAVGALLAAIIDHRNAPFLWIAHAVMLVQIVVGALGWWFHFAAILDSPMDDWWQAVVFSAPIFAPLLFANLALLAMFGIWALQQCNAAEEVEESPAEAPAPTTETPAAEG